MISLFTCTSGPRASAISLAFPHASSIVNKWRSRIGQGTVKNTSGCAAANARNACKNARLCRYSSVTYNKLTRLTKPFSLPHPKKLAVVKLSHPPSTLWCSSTLHMKECGDMPLTQPKWLLGMATIFSSPALCLATNLSWAAAALEHPGTTLESPCHITFCECEQWCGCEPLCGDQLMWTLDDAECPALWGDSWQSELSRMLWLAGWTNLGLQQDHAPTATTFLLETQLIQKSECPLCVWPNCEKLLCAFPLCEQTSKKPHRSGGDSKTATAYQQWTSRAVVAEGSEWHFLGAPLGTPLRIQVPRIPNNHCGDKSYGGRRVLRLSPSLITHALMHAAGQAKRAPPARTTRPDRPKGGDEGRKKNEPETTPQKVGRESGT